MRIAILQSNYIPWRGYFRIINTVDCFVFYDDVKYTKNDWRNRNQIILNKSLNWLTIPVGSNSDRLIDEVVLPSGRWREQHLNKLAIAYSQTPYFSEVFDFVANIIENEKLQLLSELNQVLIKGICKNWLDLKVSFEDSKNYSLTKTKSDRVLELCKKMKATHYISGPSAKNYLKVDDFTNAGIKVEWISYHDLPVYKQCSSKFFPNVSMLDVLFHQGVDAKKFI